MTTAMADTYFSEGEGNEVRQAIQGQIVGGVATSGQILFPRTGQDPVDTTRRSPALHYRW